MATAQAEFDRYEPAIPAPARPLVQRSGEIHELAAALAIAQGIIEGAAKDSANPFFKSSYADLASVWTAIRKPLSDNGLSVMQLPAADGPQVTITTILAHKSGQFISSELTVTAKEDAPQAIGSAITYARRYALQSVVGVAPEDDDGERAQGRNAAPQQARQQSRPPVAQPRASMEEPELKKLIHDAVNKFRKQYQEIDAEGVFVEILGNHGYTDVSEVPANRGIANELVNALKIRYADLSRK